MATVARAEPGTPPVAATARAALYLRVSTGRQAESDLSIPDQRRQIEGYCLSRGWQVAAETVRRRNDAPHRQGQHERRVSLLHLLDQGAAG